MKTKERIQREGKNQLTAKDAKILRKERKEKPKIKT